MISPKITGAIITTLIILLGVVLLFPAFRLETNFTSDEENEDHGQLILLTFNIVNSSNLPTWCNELSNLLIANNLHATIFMTGIMAEKYPTCVMNFSNDNDIGSMSYSHDKITSISTYPAQLDQIVKGKRIIDENGKINSTLFRAPYGSVDDNIYSLLARAHILADFSYDDHYNVYTDGQSGMTFYIFPMNTLTSLSEIQKSGTVQNGTVQNIPIMVNFYNYDPLISIENFINSTSEYPHKFVTASELTNKDLTIKRNASLS